MENPTNLGTESLAPPTDGFLAQNPLLREFLRDQVPMITVVFGLGLLAAHLQYGFVPGSDVAFPIAGVRVPIWHLVWMGFWTGYLMAIVGGASGIFSLPYTMAAYHIQFYR